MTWKDFFNTIKDSGLFGNIPAKQIIVRLFKAAGSMKEFSEDTAQSWIDNKRNCKTSKYFPNGKLNNESDAIKFFKNHPKDKLKELQQLFGKAGCDSPIDLKTNDMDIFCKSLVNQFLDFLGLERMDIENSTDSSSSSASVFDIPISCDHQEEVPQNTITESDSKSNVNTEADMFPREDFDISAQISIPEKYYVCLYCKKWKGNIHDARECKDGVYGKCLLFQQEVLSSNRKICNKFNPAYERIPFIPKSVDFLTKFRHI